MNTVTLTFKIKQNGSLALHTNSSLIKSFEQYFSLTQVAKSLFEKESEKK